MAAFTFYRWENWGSQQSKWAKLLQVNRQQIQYSTQISLTPNSVLSLFCYTPSPEKRLREELGSNRGIEQKVLSPQRLAHGWSLQILVKWMNEQLREEGCRWGQDSAHGLVSSGTDAWLWVGNRAELWMRPSGTSLPWSWEKKTVMNKLDSVTRWRGKRRPSCPWPSLRMVPQPPAQAGAQRGLHSYAQIEGCLWGFELGVWENSHVSSAWNNLKGKGPSQHLGGGWSGTGSQWAVTGGVLGSVLSDVR